LKYEKFKAHQAISVSCIISVSESNQGPSKFGLIEPIYVNLIRIPFARIKN